MKKSVTQALLNTRKQLVLADSLFTRIQPSLRDRFFISWKHIVLFSIYPFFICAVRISSFEGVRAESMRTMSKLKYLPHPLLYLVHADMVKVLCVT